jgi:hypothetical protein
MWAARGFPWGPRPRPVAQARRAVMLPLLAWRARGARRRPSCRPAVLSQLSCARESRISTPMACYPFVSGGKAPTPSPLPGGAQGKAGLHLSATKDFFKSLSVSVKLTGLPGQNPASRERGTLRLFVEFDGELWMINYTGDDAGRGVIIKAPRSTRARARCCAFRSVHRGQSSPLPKVQICMWLTNIVSSKI